MLEKRKLQCCSLHYGRRRRERERERERDMTSSLETFSGRTNSFWRNRTRKNLKEYKSKK
jgi:hypothetical protein